jgi:chemotaxis protein methyltransferase CheR
MHYATGIDPAYEPLLQLLATRTGLTFAPSRQGFAVAGIRRAMVKAGIAHTVDYLDGLHATRYSFDDLIVEMTVGETYFFRDPAQLDHLRGEIVPEIQRRRGLNHVLRVWSAGCASGEEAYSLAILLEEAGLAERSHILATDISRRRHHLPALSAARHRRRYRRRNSRGR